MAAVSRAGPAAVYPLGCVYDDEAGRSGRGAEALNSRVQIVLAAALLSTGGVAIKAASIGAPQIAGLRSGIAAVALLVFLPAARRRWSGPMILVGLAQAATFLLYVHANRLTTAASAIFLQSTAPLFILLLAPLLLHERPRRRDLVFMAVLAAGALPFFAGLQSPQATAPDPARGNVLAAVSGLSWALTLIGLRWVQVREGGRDAAAATVVCGNVIACLASLPAALPLAAGVADWWVVSYLGVFQIAAAYVLLTRGLAGVPAFEASLFILLEPVLNVVWVAWVHAESPAPASLVGGAVILSAATVKAWFDSRKPQPLPARRAGR